MVYDHCGSDMCPASSRVSCACSCARCMSHPIDADDDRACGLSASSCKAGIATLKAALAESDIRIAGVEAERDAYREALRALVEQVGKTVGLPPPSHQCPPDHAYSDFAQAINAAIALLGKGGEG